MWFSSVQHSFDNTTLMINENYQNSLVTCSSSLFMSWTSQQQNWIEMLLKKQLTPKWMGYLVFSMSELGHFEWTFVMYSNIWCEQKNGWSFSSLKYIDMTDITAPAAPLVRKKKKNHFLLSILLLLTLARWVDDTQYFLGWTRNQKPYRNYNGLMLHDAQPIAYRSEAIEWMAIDNRYVLKGLFFCLMARSLILKFPTSFHRWFVVRCWFALIPIYITFTIHIMELSFGFWGHKWRWKMKKGNEEKRQMKSNKDINRCEHSRLTWHHCMHGTAHKHLLSNRWIMDNVLWKDQRTK